MARVLIAEPNDDVRTLLELTVERLGHEVVPAWQYDNDSEIDAIVLEPACAAGRSILKRFGSQTPPIVCFSIYPREQGLEPPASVAYLLKPASTAAIGDALRLAVTV